MYRYAAHCSTEILVACYAFDDEPVKTWFPHDSLPLDLIDHIARGGIVFAHNAPFELAITKSVGPKYQFPEIKVEQARCTMAMALAMSLPAALEQAVIALDVPHKKDMEGHRLMMKLSRTTGEISKADMLRLAEYCAKDVEAERAIEKRMLNLSPPEQKVWFFDQKINQRGIGVDLPSIYAAIEIVEKEKIRLDEQMVTATEGNVSACTNVGQLKDWLEEITGESNDSLDKAAIAGLLAKELPGNVRQALLLRQEAGKSSVSKLQKMMNMAGIDGRIRGTMQYHGAGTGRWAGRGIQPHNFPRGKYKPHEVEDIFSLLHGEDALNEVALFYGKPMTVISNCLRSFIKAASGKNLISGDFAGIEARVIAWLAGEQSVLDTFARGEDPYINAYAKSFRVDPASVTPEQRQIGKILVLSLGFQGGAGALMMMAKGFGVVIVEEKAEELKVRWRAAHPKIVKFWWDLEAAALRAIRYSGEKSTVGKIAFKKSGSFLFCRLPSGRLLTYPYPKIEMQTYTSKKTGEVIEKEGVTYMGVHPKTKKWSRLKAYGGLLAENVTQATARDVMVNSMFELEEHGYPVVFTVHDEIVVECTPARIPLDSERVKTIMANVPFWAGGLPIAVEVKSGKRYSK